jgi:DNA polymerase-1
MTPRTCLVLDHANFCHRSHHTYGQQGLTTPAGEPSGVTYGLLTMALTLIQEIRPTHVAVAFESITPSERRLLYPDYKAHRGPPEETLTSQMAQANVACGHMGWARYRSPGFEADDAMAALAVEALAAGFERVYLATGDQDLLGTVTEQTSVLLMGGGVKEAAASPYTPERVLAKLGVGPERVADYKALVGDSSDHYPGVDRIGPVKARDLLVRYGSLAGIYANLETIEPVSLREILRAGQEMADLCLNLATLRHEAPLSPAFDPDAGELARVDRNGVEAYLRHLGMKSLIPRLPSLAAPAA